MAFGIGMFLGMTLGILLAAGGIIRYVVSRRYPEREGTGILVSAGLMGGEASLDSWLRPCLSSGLRIPPRSRASWRSLPFILVLSAIYTVWKRG
jgi:hypothetical protein